MSTFSSNPAVLLIEAWGSSPEGAMGIGTSSTSRLSLKDGNGWIWQVSHEKMAPGWLGYFSGIMFLPSYIGIIS